MQCIFVLVKPENSKNIGSAARALKTMGHDCLRIVGPEAADHLNAEAMALAHGSHDILENAEVFASLEEATKDCDLLVGTTARHRRTKLRYFDVDELRYSVGFGMTWLTGLGPMTFSIAKPFQSQSFDEEERFQFELGRTF